MYIERKNYLRIFYITILYTEVVIKTETQYILVKFYIQRRYLPYYSLSPQSLELHTIPSTQKYGTDKGWETPNVLCVSLGVNVVVIVCFE